MKILPAIVWLIAASLAIVSCDKIDNHRLPPANVNLVFSTIGDWNVYGVSGPGMSNTFIKEQHIPAGYFYKESEFTGFGGLLLVCDPIGNYIAYDLACPVECKSTVRVQWQTDTDEAGILICPQCGSRYNAYGFGAALSGPAVDYRYGLETYSVMVGNTMPPYAIVRR